MLLQETLRSLRPLAPIVALGESLRCDAITPEGVLEEEEGLDRLISNKTSSSSSSSSRLRRSESYWDKGGEVDDDIDLCGNAVWAPFCVMLLHRLPSLFSAGLPEAFRIHFTTLFGSSAPGRAGQGMLARLASLTTVATLPSSSSSTSTSTSSSTSTSTSTSVWVLSDKWAHSA